MTIILCIEWFSKRKRMNDLAYRIYMNKVHKLLKNQINNNS